MICMRAVRDGHFWKDLDEFIQTELKRRQDESEQSLKESGKRAVLNRESGLSPAPSPGPNISQALLSPVAEPRDRSVSAPGSAYKITGTQLLLLELVIAIRPHKSPPQGIASSSSSNMKLSISFMHSDSGSFVGSDIQEAARQSVSEAFENVSLNSAGSNDAGRLFGKSEAQQLMTPVGKNYGLPLPSPTGSTNGLSGGKQYEEEAASVPLLNKESNQGCCCCQACPCCHACACCPTQYQTCSQCPACSTCIIS